MATYTRIHYKRRCGFQTWMPVYNDGTICEMTQTVNKGKVERFRETCDLLNWTITQEEQTDSSEVGPSWLHSTKH